MPIPVSLRVRVIGKRVTVFKRLDRHFGSKLYTASSVEQVRDIIHKQRAHTK
ncbi:MAG: hypothetical protein U0694_23250 [Anaerolineae bacterium]